jgi:hypothetical protein
VFRVLISVIFGGMAFWFLRNRYDRKEPTIWFLVWLMTAAANYALSAVAFWVDDRAISQSFWVASFVALSASLFLVFAFARSFSVDASHALFFWSVPLMFNAALIIMNPEAIFVRSGDSWVLREINAAVVICIAIITFYALSALYYAFMLHHTLRSHRQKAELHNFRYILGGLLIVFSSAAVGGWLKASVNPWIPVLEIGNLLGALMIMRVVTGPIAGIRMREARGER